MTSLVPLTLCAAIAQTAPADPHNLPIGRSGAVKVAPGQMLDLRTGKPASVSDVAVAARGLKFVYVGESHDQPAHHQFQADVIKALVADGRDVIVGFEMFTRPVQNSLDPWSRGWWTEEQFIVESDWKKQWGFDFAIYRPIFEACKAHQLPMVALNVPRDIVRKVGRGGASALSADEQSQFPTIETNNPNHRTVFNALMGGHPPTGPTGENIYSAQVLWDTAMADSALKYLARAPRSQKTVFVVIAGIGHVMYDQGINYQIERRTGQKGITVVAISQDEPGLVAKGIGDFVASYLPFKAAKD